MAVLVSDLCTEAYRKIGVIAAGETASTDEMATALTAYQQLVSSWNESLKKSLAGSYASEVYTFVPLTVPAALADSAVASVHWQRAIVYALAVELAPEFRKPVSAEVAALAGASKTQVIKLEAVL